MIIYLGQTFTLFGWLLFKPSLYLDDLTLDHVEAYEAIYDKNIQVWFSGCLLVGLSIQQNSRTLTYMESENWPGGGVFVWKSSISGSSGV